MRLLIIACISSRAVIESTDRERRREEQGTACRAIEWLNQSSVIDSGKQG